MNQTSELKVTIDPIKLISSMVIISLLIFIISEQKINNYLREKSRIPILLQKLILVSLFIIYFVTCGAYSTALLISISIIIIITIDIISGDALRNAIYNYEVVNDVNYNISMQLLKATYWDNIINTVFTILGIAFIMISLFGIYFTIN